jgi:penicillin-binding protein 2
VRLRKYRRILAFWLCALAIAVGAQAATPQTPASPTTAKAKKRRRRVRPKVATAATTMSANRTTTRAGVLRTPAGTRTKVAVARRRTGRRRVFYNPWTEPTYADSTVGDNVEGEDPVVRKAAVDALGPYNGTVVVADPQTGRLLSVVNQKLALKGAYQPCSTVKMVVSLASLSEGIVDPASHMRITRRISMDMPQALAHSNNFYFAKMGQELGIERIERYAKMFGLGEKAGLDIPGEEAGFVSPVAPESGVGMMTSFGDGIRLTALELTAIVNSIANGGTMYYLQYPRSDEEVQKFIPRIKRELEIAHLIPQVKSGMMGATEYGTARRAAYDVNEPIYGKTGTCTDTAQPGVHLGWFGSFNDVSKNRVAVVVLLTGGRGISGPIAAGVAGNVYRNLSMQHYFAPESPSQPTVAGSLIPISGSSSDLQLTR